MLGLLFGAVCLVGLVMMLRRVHRARFCGPWGWPAGPGPLDDRWDGPPRGFGGRGPASFVRRRVLDHLSASLGATPGQEKVLAAAADELVEAGRAAHETLRATRKDVAEVFAGPAFDEALLGDTFGKQDEAIRNLRLAATGAFARVHEVLEPDQRRRLAEILARGPRRWGF